MIRIQNLIRSHFCNKFDTHLETLEKCICLQLFGNVWKCVGNCWEILRNSWEQFGNKWSFFENVCFLLENQ